MTLKQTVETTAVVYVQPGADPAVVALYQEGVKLLQYAEARVVQCDEDVKIATDDLSVIATRKKTLEARRKEYTGPLNDHLTAVNAAFRRFVEPLVHVDTLTQDKVDAYRAEQNRVREEQERINALRMEAARAEMVLTGELSEPVDLVPVAEVAPKRYQTDMGTVGMTKTRKWEVVDLSLVPLEYMMIDASRVGKVVRAGIPSIPGIRIYVKEGLRVTARKE